MSPFPVLRRAHQPSQRDAIQHPFVYSIYKYNINISDSPDICMYIYIISIYLYHLSSCCAVRTSLVSTTLFNTPSFIRSIDIIYIYRIYPIFVYIYIISIYLYHLSSCCAVRTSLVSATPFIILSSIRSIDIIYIYRIHPIFVHIYIYIISIYL